MNQFQEAIEFVLKAHKLLEWFNSGQRFYARFDMPYYSSLVIKRQREKITVGHYCYLLGDLIGDPVAELHYPTWNSGSDHSIPGGGARRSHRSERRAFNRGKYSPDSNRIPIHLGGDNCDGRLGHPLHQDRQRLV